MDDQVCIIRCCRTGERKVVFREDGDEINQSSPLGLVAKVPMQ